MNNSINTRIATNDLLAEGLADWQEICEGRAAHAARRAGEEPNEVAFRRDCRNARRAAARIGLAYWPALLPVQKHWLVDPAAYVAAEAVLAGRHGLYGRDPVTGQKCHGGWDAMGHHGVSPGQVRRMWQAAGCRDGRKFRAQVRTGVLAMKGDTAPFAQALGVGMMWFTRNQAAFTSHVWMSRKAIAVLGRLSPVLRWAAMDNVASGDSPVRVRDLNWAAVKAAQANTKVAASYAPPRMLAELAGEGFSSVAYLAPSFPLVSLTVARRLARGESPMAIYDTRGLTPKLAHKAMLAGVPRERLAELWLAAVPEVAALPWGLCDRLRSLWVAQWVIEVVRSGRWEAMERQRHQYVGGQRLDFRFLDILDEVQEDDIVTLKDGVNTVFGRASQRNGEEFYRRNKEDHRVLQPSLPSWTRTLPRFARVLNTPAQLAGEGREMQHCVGTYVQAVESGQSIIVALRDSTGRSTVEFSADGRVVRQHFTVLNAEPPARHARWLALWRARHIG